MYDFALVSKQQLEDAGFNIDLQVVDWATLVKRRNNPKEYDAFTTGIGPFYEPTARTVPQLRLAGLDLRRGHPARADADGPGDRSKSAYALWDQQTRSSTRRCPSSATGTSSGFAASARAPRLQRPDRAATLLQRVARPMRGAPDSGSGPAAADPGDA